MYGHYIHVSHIAYMCTIVARVGSCVNVRYLILTMRSRSLGMGITVVVGVRYHATVNVEHKARMATCKTRSTLVENGWLLWLVNQGSLVSGQLLEDFSVVYNTHSTSDTPQPTPATYF